MTLSTPIVFGEPHVFGEPSYGRDTDTDGTDGASFPALIASGGFSDIKIVHKRRRNAGAVCRQGDRAARTDRRMSETGPTAAYRQHHDVEAPRVDERHFLPAWRVLTRLDGLLADHAITSAEWHAAADFRELVRSGPMPGVHQILGVRDRPRGRKFIRELGRRRSRCVGQAPPDPRRARCLGLHVARGGASAGSVLGRARAALSLRSENRARLGNRRNQSASYRLKEGDRNGEGLQTGWRTDLRRNARERRGCASRKSAPADPPLAPQPRQVARGEEVAFLPSAATRALFQSARLEQYAAISRALAMIAGTRAGVQEDEDRRIRVYAC